MLYRSDIYRNIIKRILDIIISLVLLVIFSPLMLLIALIVLIDLGWPLHNEIRKRYGKNKKIFIMYKFRTKKLISKRVNDDDKYTKVSAFIDKTRLNELPQLINVIKGDMSLVGPRPFIPNDSLPEGNINKKRYLLRPGMTGLAQVSGGRGLSHKEKLKYDEIYYDNLSFKLDLKIIIKTITFRYMK